MTQNVLDYSENPNGNQLMDTFLAGMAQNQLTNHSGVSRPSYAVAGTFWIDTSVTPWILKQYNGTNDVTIGTLDQTNLYFTAPRAIAGANGTNIETALASKAVYPSQSGQSGKFLTTNGTTVSWGTASSSLSGLSDTTINSPTNGQALMYNGSKWVNGTVSGLPSMTGNSGKYLTNDGSSASWGLSFQPVVELPTTPDDNTIYFITG